MGAAEGAVEPVGVAAAAEASHPKRRGMNNGFFQCSISLFGLAIAPIVATQLLEVTSWRMVFMIVGIPGLIVAIIIWFIIREPATIAAPGHADTPKRAPLLELLAILQALDALGERRLCRDGCSCRDAEHHL